MNDFYAKLNKNGNYSLLYTEDGRRVTRLDYTCPIVWPVASNAMAYHDHPEGIMVTEADAVKLDVPLELS